VRRLACLFALAAAVASAPAQANGPLDSWSGQDKMMHFGMSAPLGMLGASVAEKFGVTGKTERLVVGAALGMMPGLAKEWADRYNPRATASVKDMAFNVLGAILGAATVDCCTVRALSSRRDRFDGLAVEYKIEF
jgi:VanZ family protein